MNVINRYCTTLLSVILLSLMTYACGTGPDDTTPLPQFSSIEAPGDSAHAFLSDQQFSKLSLEIDYMPGYKPTDQALDSLKTFLEHNLHKSTINIETPTDVPSGGKNAYSAQDLVQLEEQHRDHYTTLNQASGDTLWAYFMVTDGEFTQQNVLGVAYLNTSMAFFGPTIHNNSGGISQADRYKLEATVFAHEFGHNMGLVANGSPMQQDHQDEANGHHCTQQNCLMYYAVETTDYTSFLQDKPIPDILQYGQADIEANGGK